MRLEEEQGMKQLVFAIPLLGLGLLAGGATTPPAPAQAASQGLSRSDFIATMDGDFRRRDADGDGFISRSELQQFERNLSLEVAIRENAQVFQRLDADRNGALTLEEFSKLVAVPPAPDVTSILDQPDRNRDQKVTIVEYRAATLANFDRLDTDLDGIVTDAEMKAGNVPVPPTPTR